MIDLHAIPVPNNDFRMRQVGDEIVFLAESGKEVLSLNAVGAFIWEQIDGNHAVRDILDIICHEYEVDEDTARADLDAFITQLAEHDLVTLQTPGD